MRSTRSTPIDCLRSAARRLRYGVLISAGLLGVSLLAACTLEPRYRAPPLPVPNQWPIPPTGAPGPDAAAGTAADTAAASASGAGAATVGVARVEDIGWRDFFADPHLQQIIALALQNNRDLRVAVLNIQLSRAQYRQPRADLLPTINGNANYQKERLPAAEFGFPITAGFYTVGVALSSFELDLFGHVRSLNHAALQQYFAQSEARRSTQLSLIAQVAQAYLTLASDRQLLRLAQDTLKSQLKSYDITSKEHASGQVSGLDVAQADTTVESARSDVARYQGNIAQDIDALTLVVGAPVDTSMLPQALDDRTIGIAALPAQLPSVVLLRRPDVLEAEHTLRSDNANIGAARAEFFPQISLTGNIGSLSPQLTGLFESGTGTWTYAPQISVPIFHGGALLAGLTEARVNRDIALAQYEKAIQTAFREVADGLALTHTLASERAAQQALVKATGRAYEISQERYKAGSDSYLNVLDSQRSYYSAQQSLIATELAQQDNRVSLYEALGGGWREHSR